MALIVGVDLQSIPSHDAVRCGLAVLGASCFRAVCNKGNKGNVFWTRRVLLNVSGIRHATSPQCPGQEGLHVGTQMACKVGIRSKADLNKTCMDVKFIYF